MRYIFINHSSKIFYIMMNVMYPYEATVNIKGIYPKGGVHKQCVTNVRFQDFNHEYLREPKMMVIELKLEKYLLRNKLLRLASNEIKRRIDDKNLDSVDVNFLSSDRRTILTTVPKYFTI